MEEQIKKSLEKIRPILQRDGGDVEFVSVEDGVVKVKMQGACGGCPGALMTIKMIIERTLVEDVPGVKEVIGV
ncbi:Fe-S cluster biogenesis protein NfuA, 4Fe-4S-binding domain [Dethiosulfatibacter aminovorans DSM 17477]|uniref:Fe-S cluster biogenesis protein NfuA, 4Fe-4S-binding domain n=1 Tax=Dethiosulfatibacter aminovorans DSM 17477 TaxID=1121476 RepID=A0A1M6I2B4_9FIRM|nr:NifU family protein [Dethiosulfatibacter aminovorans]SHJ28374.1 Fe-S cluster biogenesis protein NfuA, 4Fe-4S-binding domain [Dethiosulfatibacter aminovorans DSM 17477]